MKLSDYVAEFLVKNQIRDLFTISGGGIMHLLDSAAKNSQLNVIYNLNEQATGICADSYAQYTNYLGACLVTTGPGATNAITGCAGAWLDSDPVMYISGQTKTADMGQLRGLRQFGAQEIAIVPMVQPITKYAITVLDANEIKYHLEKAIYLATHGRRGPVWIDIPLDIQASQVNVETLRGFLPDKDLMSNQQKGFVKNEDIIQLYDCLNAAKRPLVLIGHGVVAAGQGSILHQLLDEFKIPVLSSWRAKGIYGDEERLNMGAPGIPTTRYSNYVLQNADFLLILGCRLNPAITAYDEKNFARNAVKIIVDIDENEINKLSMEFSLKINADIAEVVSKLVCYKENYIFNERDSWLKYCDQIKAKYPLNKEKQPYDNEGKVDGYVFANKLSEYMTKDDVYVGSSSGRTCGISHMAIKIKKEQKFITSMGLGSMGWCIPSAIASCIASGKKRTIVFEGDGSLQHNIQELALINTYQLPIKIFILSNEGYASIYMMQKKNFQENYAGCTMDSGLCLPKMDSIAKSYGLEYFLIKNNFEIESTLKKIMVNNKPAICEVQGSINFDEIPKSLTIVNKDGTFSSSSLENLYPYIDKKEQAENMPNWPE